MNNGTDKGSPCGAFNKDDALTCVLFIDHWRNDFLFGSPDMDLSHNLIHQLEDNSHYIKKVAKHVLSSGLLKDKELYDILIPHVKGIDLILYLREAISRDYESFRENRFDLSFLPLSTMTEQERHAVLSATKRYIETVNNTRFPYRDNIKRKLMRRICEALMKEISERHSKPTTDSFVLEGIMKLIDTFHDFEGEVELNCEYAIDNIAHKLYKNVDVDYEIGVINTNEEEEE